MERIRNNRFAKNASWIIIGRVFQLILTFVTTMLVARYLGPELYGTINYAFSYVAIFSPLCTLGFNDIIVKELLDKNNRKDEILGTIISIRFVSSAFTIGLIYLFVTLVGNSDIVITVTILQALSLVFQAFDSIISFYQSGLLSKKSSIVNIVAYTLSSAFRIIGLIIKKDIKWFAFAVSLDYLLISALLLLVYFKDGNKLSFSFGVAKKLLKKSSSYLFASIMIVIYTKAGDMMLGKMIDETNVGYYTAATTLCNAWPFVLQAIIDSASPIIIDLHEKDYGEYQRRIKQLYAAIFYIGLFVAICITILAKVIIMILYSEEYLPSITPLRIVCWNTIFSYFGVARASWMQCEKKYQYERILSLLGAISNIVLNFILIKKFGIIGAAITLVLTQFLTNFVYVFVIKGTRENAKLIVDAIMLKGIFK